VLVIRLGFSLVTYYGQKDVRPPTVNEAPLRGVYICMFNYNNLDRCLLSIVVGSTPQQILWCIIVSARSLCISRHGSTDSPGPLLLVSNLRTPLDLRPCNFGLLCGQSPSDLLSFVMIPLPPRPRSLSSLYTWHVPSKQNSALSLGSRDPEVDSLMTSCQSIVVTPLGPL
jgi:hypothetical protein